VREEVKLYRRGSVDTDEHELWRVFGFWGCSAGEREGRRERGVIAV